MVNRLMIIVTGAPGTGKTTLSRQISEKFGIPIIAKDEIKELLFDSIGVGDRQWSIKLSKASYNLLFSFAEKLLLAGRPFIVEGNFDNASSIQNFLNIKSKMDFQTLQIHCYTEPETLYERYKARDASGERHKGHIHQLPEFEEYRERFNGKCYKLDIDESIIIDLDTTDFAQVNYEHLYSQIDEILRIMGGCINGEK